MVDFGFYASIFPEVRYLSNMKEKVLVDRLSPKYGVAEPKNLKVWHLVAIFSAPKVYVY